MKRTTYVAVIGLVAANIVGCAGEVDDAEPTESTSAELSRKGTPPDTPERGEAKEKEKEENIEKLIEEKGYCPKDAQALQYRANMFEKMLESGRLPRFHDGEVEVFGGWAQDAYRLIELHKDLDIQPAGTAVACVRADGQPWRVKLVKIQPLTPAAANAFSDFKYSLGKEPYPNPFLEVGSTTVGFEIEIAIDPITVHFTSSVGGTDPSTHVAQDVTSTFPIDLGYFPQGALWVKATTTMTADLVGAPCTTQPQRAGATEEFSTTIRMRRNLKAGYDFSCAE